VLRRLWAVGAVTVARQREFALGAGQQTQALGALTCSTCGFSHENRKLFKREGDGHVCSTGHYEDGDGNMKRAKNPYARF
jgi:hypothetical protein